MKEEKINDKKLESALMGKTKSSGGLNIDELRSLLERKMDLNVDNLKKLSRKELETYGLKMSNNKSIPKKVKPSNSNFSNERFELLKKSTSPKKINSTNKYYQGKYSETEKKYCRCIAHVVKKENVTKTSQLSPRKSRGPYNPYAVCQNSVKPNRKNGVIECSKYYANDYNLKENDEFIPMAKFHHKTPTQYSKFLKNLKN